MNKKPSSKLPHSVSNSEDGDFSKKHHTLILDEKVTKIINKYKTYAPHRNNLATGINKVIENKKFVEEAQPLKINTHTSSERQNNYVCENSFNIKSNKNKFPPVVNKNTLTRADKTTYCRPVTKYYIPEVYRMATKRNGERNILQILSTLRQKEVEEALMSTYIDFLKKKHLPEECISLTCIQDIIGSKARMISMKRDQMVDHLNEKCIPHSIINKPHQHRFHGTFNSIEDLAYKQVWYPVIRSPRKKVFHVTQNGPETKLFDDERYKNCSTQLTEDKKYVMTTRPANSQTKRAVKNCNTQTHTNVFQPKKLCFDKSATTNVEKKNHHKQEEITENSVLTIENKIDTLIQAMNDFMNEINLLKITNSEEKRRKKCNNKSQTPTEELIDYNIKNHRNIVSYTYLPSREQKSCKLEETVVNTHKANFDKISKNSSIQIKFKVSTRDHCTEISRSLSRQITNCKIIADTSQTEKTTIALNTDPISFRALLKISSEAIRGFFSLDFLSYLPYLQLPRLEWSDPRPCLCDTNVNVDKITNRFLKLAPVGPYKCQYCDEVFDKACSWERHDFYCARTLKALERKCGMFRVC